MTLREQQSKFAKMAAELILKAYELGYEVTLGDAYRDPRLHGEHGVKKAYGAANSFHKLRLAIDLNLFKDGKFLGTSEDHRKLGEWWESKGGTWGGRWTGSRSDGNHYSLGE
jgi:hypothetical protein